MLVGEGCDRLDVEDLGLRVGDGLAEEELGVGPDGRPPRVDRRRVLDEAHLDAELRQRVLEEVEGAAVEAGGDDDVVAGLGDVEHGERLGGLARGDEERADAALERCDALLDDVGRRVHQAGVDVAELLEPEQVRRVVGVVEDVARRLVDRQGARAGGAVGALSGVDLLGLEGPAGLGHGSFLHFLGRVDDQGPRSYRARRTDGSVRERGSPRLPARRVASTGQVFTRGTPPRLEGCRPASRGLSLALMTYRRVYVCVSASWEGCPHRGRVLTDRRHRAGVCLALLGRSRSPAGAVEFVVHRCRLPS